MWQAHLSRRALLEALLAGNKVAVREVSDFSGSRAYVLRDDEFLVYWKADPRLVDDLPLAIVGEEGGLRHLLAVLNSTPQLPSPFTAFCRLISKELLIDYSEVTDSPGSSILDGLVGVAMAESLYYSGDGLKPADLSPAICERTLSYSFAKALINCPISALPKVVGGWFDAHTLLAQGRLDSLRKAGRASQPIFSVAVEIFYGLEPDGVFSRFCGDILNTGEPTEKAWRELSAELIDAPSLADFGAATREERSAIFQRTLARMPISSIAGGGDRLIAACAFIATRISPGSFEHMALLLGYENPALVMWYGFFGAIQRRSQALKAYGGLGVRIRRDLFIKGDMTSPPVTDISIEELFIFAKGRLDLLAKRTRHSNEVSVELSPLLSCGFRYYGKGERKSEQNLFQGSPQQEIPLASVEPTLHEKIEQARKLLAEISKELPTSSVPVKPRSKAKVSKKSGSITQG